MSGLSAGCPFLILNSWFIRHWPKEWSSHTREQNAEIQQQLFDAHEIGIYYQATCSLDPTAYPEDQRRYINMFLSLAKEGGYVCAKYPALHTVLVGQVPEGSRIVCDENFHFLKRLKLTRVINIPSIHQSRLLAGSPQQTTLTRWKAIGDRLVQLLEDKRVEPSWQMLQPCEQETVCQEFLRAIHGLKYLLLPIGRALEDVDILGINAQGQRILAQVTYDGSSSQLLNKATRLARYDGQRFFFCGQPEKVRAMPLKAQVTFISTDEVWQWLQREKIYKREIFTFL